MWGRESLPEDFTCVEGIIDFAKGGDWQKGWRNDDSCQNEYDEKVQQVDQNNISGNQHWLSNFNIRCLSTKQQADVNVEKGERIPDLFSECQKEDKRQQKHKQKDLNVSSPEKWLRDNRLV